MATPFSSVPWLANPGAWWARDTAAGQLGVQIARNQIAAEGQRAQLQKEAQLLPLQKAAIEASTKLHEMQMQSAELGIQHELAQQAGEKDLAEAVVTAGEIGWQDQQVPWLLGKVGAAHPSLLDSPVFKQAMDWHNKARSAQDFVDRSAGNLEARLGELERRRGNDVVGELQKEAGLDIANRRVTVQEGLAAAKLQHAQDVKDGRVAVNDPEYSALLRDLDINKTRKDVNADQKYLLSKELLANFNAARSKRFGQPAPAAAVEKTIPAIPAGQMGSAQPLAPVSSGTNEIIRYDKNGRRMIFDAKTNKPLRYAD